MFRSWGTCKVRWGQHAARLNQSQHLVKVPFLSIKLDLDFLFPLLPFRQVQTAIDLLQTPTQQASKTWAGGQEAADGWVIKWRKGGGGRGGGGGGGRGEVSWHQPQWPLNCQPRTASFISGRLAAPCRVQRLSLSAETAFSSDDKKKDFSCLQGGFESLPPPDQRAGSGQSDDRPHVDQSRPFLSPQVFSSTPHFGL